jgi:ketosteroid isomerase-like protein
MSKENVDLVREHIGDVDLARVLRDDEAWAARLSEIEPHFKDDFEFVVLVPGEPVTGKGFDEFRVRFLDWIEPWETYQPNIEQIIDLGDRVVVVGRDHGRIKGADHNIEGPKGLVLYHFDAGRVTRVEYYFDRDQGLRAVWSGYITPRLRLGRRSIVSWFRRQAVACLPEASTIRAVDETLGVRPERK